MSKGPRDLPGAMVAVIFPNLNPTQIAA